mmetsp:Transcript_54196/g.131503  ORF Transcript_54196/g.131503 Transcript_54196/m.131503 type:complete len:665 (+) Transcript_54196:211-2205(+)
MNYQSLNMFWTKPAAAGAAGSRGSASSSSNKTKRLRTENTATDEGSTGTTTTAAAPTSSSTTTAIHIANSTAPDAKMIHDVDKVLAHEISLLSVDEREQVMQDLHGIQESTTEVRGGKISSSSSKNGNGNDKKFGIVRIGKNSSHHQVGDNATGTATTDGQTTSPSSWLEMSRNAIVQTAKLEEMQRVIDDDSPNSALNPENKAAYEMAVRMSPSYVNDRKFRLMFLRAERMDVVAAAKRFCFFFQIKLELFGPDLLGRERITQDDLCDETLDLIDNGSVQILPLRDVAGRIVHLLFQQAETKEHPGGEIEKCLLQKLFYLTMTAIDPDDVEAQEMGRVALVFLHEKSKASLDPSAAWRATRLVWAYPIRTAASHICCSPQYEKSLWVFVAMLRLSQDPYTKLRNRVHVGSYTENNYSLMAYGIPTSVLPIDLFDGTVSKEYFDIYMKAIREYERSTTKKMEKHETQLLSMPSDSQTSSPAMASSAGAASLPSQDGFVSTPSNHDVLIGKGKFFQYHTGNVRFRFLVEEYREQYENAERQNKNPLCQEVVDLIKSRGGRFLKIRETTDGDGSISSSTLWVEVLDAEARRKTSMCFRSQKRAAKLKKESDDMEGNDEKNSKQTLTNKVKRSVFDVIGDDDDDKCRVRMLCLEQKQAKKAQDGLFG